MSSGNSIWNNARGWLSEQLQLSRSSSTASRNAITSSRAIRLSACGALVFCATLGVRLLYWQDINAAIQRGDDAMRTNLVKPYEREANRIQEEGGILFPAQPRDSQDARMILHPPGYSILLAVIRKDGDSVTSYSRLRWLQIISDGCTAVMILLIAAHWFPLTLGTIAGMLVALSPHLAHYSLWLTPETLAVLPLAAAIYLIAIAVDRPRIWTMIAAGGLVGVSCWLRSNGLLLVLFLAVAVLLLLEREKRLKYSGVLVAAMIVSITPVTLRNWTSYHRFIPLSLGAGITMAEGIADYDTGGRFGMPVSDQDVKHKDAAWHNRPDYARNIWTPDGVDRDRARFSRAISVVRSHPFWFAGVMMRRAFSMLRYNDSMTLGGNADIAHAPNVSAEPSFGNELAVPEGSQPTWATSAAEFLAGGVTLSTGAMVALTADAQKLRVTGDATSFGDQFASNPIPVERHTDYLLRVAVRIEQRPMVAKVTSADRRILLISDFMQKSDSPTKKEAQRRARRNAERGIANDAAHAEEDANRERKTQTVQMPFASGARSEVRLVISNNGQSTAPPVVEVGSAELFELGPTPQRWTRGARLLVHRIQRNVFTTSLLLPLIVAGIVLLALAERKRELMLLLVVPSYFFCVQSAFHTEYRYILTVHYFLFGLAAVTLYVGGTFVWGVARRIPVVLRRTPD